MKFLLFLIMFFVVSALLIISNENLKLNEEGTFEIFKDSYFEWLDQIYVNSQTITGNVVGLDWTP